MSSDPGGGQASLVAAGVNLAPDGGGGGEASGGVGGAKGDERKPETGTNKL